MDATNFSEIIDSAKKTHEERGKQYGEMGWLNHAAVLKAMFPEGLTLKTEEEFGRFALFNLQLTKIIRYSKSIDRGGHQDSTHDLGVYSFLLEQYDAIMKQKLSKVVIYPDAGKVFK